MFGAYAFGAGYFGQGPLEGVAPQQFFLEICETAVVSLMPLALVECLVDTRSVMSLVEQRTVEPFCP